MSSWIKLYRQFLDWEWFNDPHMVQVFVYFLLQANHEDKSWRGIKVERGQLIFGRKRLAETLAISEQSLRSCLKKLKSTNEITIKSTNKYSLVTLVKWESYQSDNKKSTSKLTSKLTNDQPATNQQLTTPKEYKNIRSKEIDVIPGIETRAGKYVDYLNSVFGRNYKPTKKVIGNFKARIENDKYPTEVLRAVIENLKKSTYHIDTKFSYCTPEFCLRQDKIEMYKSGPIIQKAPNGKTDIPEPPKKQDQSKHQAFSDFLQSGKIAAPVD